MKPITASVFAVAALLIAGCGSHPSSTASNPAQPSPLAHPYAQGYIPGPAMFPQPKTQTASLPASMRFLAAFLPGMAQASTGQPYSGTITMSFSGQCGIPRSFASPAASSTPAVGIPVEVNGVGNPGCAVVGGNTTILPGDGDPVVGSGTLQIFRAYANAPAADTGGYVLDVWVNGSKTGLECAFAAGATKCADDTDTAPVNDGDMVVVTATVDAATAAASQMTNVRILLGKN